MRPKANCNISKVYKERRKRGGGKKTQRQQQGEIDTTTNLPSPSASLSLSLFLSHSLSATSSNSPTRLPPLSITASFPTVMSAPGAGREQGRGEVLQGIRVFKIYTLAFLLWVISANSPPPFLHICPLLPAGSESVHNTSAYCAPSDPQHYC